MPDTNQALFGQCQTTEAEQLEAGVPASEARALAALSEEFSAWTIDRTPAGRWMALRLTDDAPSAGRVEHVCAHELDDLRDRLRKTLIPTRKRLSYL